MHSKPIDLLVRAPEQPKTPPSDSEPDGRFSELLRRPSDTGAKPAATEPKDRPTDTAAAPGQDSPAAEFSVQGEPRAVIPAREAGIVGDAFIEALAVIPVAITQTAPAPAPPDANSSDGTVAPVPQAAPAPPAAPPAPAVPTPAVATPAAGATSDAVPVLGASGRQESGPIGGQTAIPAPLTNSGNGAPPAAPIAIAPAAPTAPVLPTHPADAAAEPNTAGIETARTTAEGPGSGIESPPVIIASNAPAAAPLDAAPADGSVPSVQALAIAPKVRAAPIRTTNIAGEARAAPEAADVVDVPDLADPAEPAVANAAAKAGVAAKPIPGSAATAANSTGDRSIALTAQPAARPDAASAELPATTAQPESSAAAAPASSARPAVEAAALAQTGGRAAPPPPASEQVVLQLRRAVAEGVDRLTVQLKPASLGRVDVQMEVGHDGRLQALISAERPETLHLLQRDARALTTALNDAGLQTDSGSLSFNLRGQTGDQAGGGDGMAQDGAPESSTFGAADGDDSIAPITLTLGPGRVDIKV